MFKSLDYVKIFHGSDSDLKFLVADLGVVTLNVFDTARALLFLQKIPALKEVKEGNLQITKNIKFLSLKKLTAMILDVHLDKFFAVADWRIRPLPDGMFDYARSDSHFLIPIYLILMTMLTPKGVEKLCMTPALAASQDEIPNPYL